MTFGLKKAAEPSRDIRELVARASHPQCHRCGGETYFLGMLEQPIFGEPGKGLAQYACETCQTLVEELRPL